MRHNVVLVKDAAKPLRDGAPATRLEGLPETAASDLRTPFGAPPVARLGPDLRLARERLGWSLGAVSEHLRIKLAYLAALETGQVAALPSRAYAIGFVRAYATLLGLDPAQAAKRLRAEMGGLRGKTELIFPVPAPERGVPALAVVAVGLVLAIGAYAGWYRLSGERRPGPEVVQMVPERLAPLAAPPVAVAAAVAPPVATPPPAPPPAEVEAEAEPPPELPSVSPSQAAAASPPPLPPSVASRIVVRARADCWIQVKDGKGQLLLNRVLREGESWTVPGRPVSAALQPALLLTTGNAGGTELVVDGVAAASLGGDGTVRRDLPLDADTIRDGKLPPLPAPPFRVSPRNQ